MGNGSRGWRERGPVGKTKKHNLGYVRECFRGYELQVVGTLLFLALARAASTADPLYLKKIFDGIGAGEAFSGIAGAVTIYFALRIASFVGELLRDWIFAPVEIGVGRKVSETVFDYLL